MLLTLAIIGGFSAATLAILVRARRTGSGVLSEVRERIGVLLAPVAVALLLQWGDDSILVLALGGALVLASIWLAFGQAQPPRTGK